jgi:hypothetical protein
MRAVVLGSMNSQLRMLAPAATDRVMAGWEVRGAPPMTSVPSSTQAAPVVREKYLVGDIWQGTGS